MASNSIAPPQRWHSRGGTSGWLGCGAWPLPSQNVQPSKSHTSQRTKSRLSRAELKGVRNLYWSFSAYLVDEVLFLAQGAGRSFLSIGSLTDILDGHFMQGLSWTRFRRARDVYSKWMKTGKAVGCWQTEMGHGFATNPIWLPQTWFQDLGWALARRLLTAPPLRACCRWFFVGLDMCHIL